MSEYQVRVLGRGVKRAPYRDCGGHRVLVMVSGTGEELGRVSVDPKTEQAVARHLEAALDLLDPEDPPLHIV